MTKPTIFKGSGVALVTPMSPDGSVNYETMDQLIEWHIKEGTAAIISCGTTGETSTLTDEEHLEVMRRTIETVNGRIPVIAGCGSNHTDYAAWLTKEAAAMGADGTLHVTPYYNKTSQAGLVKHFTHLADLTDLPMILYNVPGRTGMTVQPETYLELSKHPNIVATKEASGNISAIAKTISLCGDALAVYSGNDDQIIPLMSLGAIGVITVIGNIAPKFTQQMCLEYLEGDKTKATQMQLEAIPLCDAMFCDINPIPAKEGLAIMGWEVGEPRMPLVPTSNANRDFIKDVLEQFGIL